jgi:hypothetical protein
VRVVLWAIILAGCARPDPGISREKAENILRGFGMQNINVGATLDGWIGTADHGPGTYTIRIKVDRHGLINWNP